jgi:hypothetical protein
MPGLLEIKNWTKYQSSNTHKWIKDYSNREDDDGFSKLSMFQRGVLEGLCRLRARSGKPICYEVVHIVSALQAIPVDRHCMGRAIGVLIERGFLIPLNQQLNSEDLTEERRVEESRREENNAMSFFKERICRLARKHLRVTIRTNDPDFAAMLAQARTLNPDPDDKEKEKGQAKVLDAFEEFCIDREGTTVDRPLRAFLNRFDGIMEERSTSGQEQNLGLEQLVNHLVRASNGEVLFDRKQTAALKHLLEKYTQEEIRAAFGEFWGNISGDDFQIKHAARKFAETGGEQLLILHRQRREEAREQEEEMKRLDEQRQAEVDARKAARAAERAREEELAEDELPMEP